MTQVWSQQNWRQFEALEAATFQAEVSPGLGEGWGLMDLAFAATQAATFGVSAFGL